MNCAPLPALLGFLRKAGLVGLTALAAGTAGAFFLWSLDGVTRMQFAHPWLLCGLPLAGFAVAWLYQKSRALGGAGNGADFGRGP